MGAFLASGLFKIIGTIGTVAAVVLAIWLGIVKAELALTKREDAAQIKELQGNLASAQIQAATWEAGSKANEAEAKRLSADLEKAKASGIAEAAALKKQRDAIAANYSKLKDQVINVAKTDDRHLGPVGISSYNGMRSIHQTSTAARGG